MQSEVSTELCTEFSEDEQPFSKPELFRANTVVRKGIMQEISKIHERDTVQWPRLAEGMVCFALKVIFSVSFSFGKDFTL